MGEFDSFNEEINQLLAEYRAQLAQAGELQRRIREISGTATAPRQTVKVTVGAQGELTALEFPTGAYKRMAPNELSEAILGAAREAQAKAMESVRGLVAPRLPGGVDFLDLIKGEADLSAALPADPPLPDAVREYIDGGRIVGRGREAVGG